LRGEGEKRRGSHRPWLDVVGCRPDYFGHADPGCVDIHERWTDTWLRMSTGKWQCIASQQTEIKP